MYALTSAAHVATTHTSSGNSWIGPVLLILIGVILGRFWGRRAGLRHLGEHEFRQRWANIRKISSW